MKTLSITADLADIRLDKYLAEEIELISRSRIKKSIIANNVLVDGESVKPSFRLSGGEMIQVELPQPEPTDLESQPIAFDIIHEDDDIILLNKPAGLVVHPGAGNRNGTLVNGLIHHFDQLSSLSGRFRPGIVHRLDKDTSGIMVIAKNDIAHANLSEQFSRRTVKKTYLALVWGVPGQDKGIIDRPIVRHPKERTLFSVGEGGRAATTAYRVLECFEELSLLELSPLTGRTHQLRVHLADISHPIFADDSYGGGAGKAKGYVPELSRVLSSLVNKLARQALHALSLEFDHPCSRESQSYIAPIPNDLASVLHALEPEDV
ncbi:MAG: RluA family pseudouridine synthase [Candidatus Neomarinimicrobiota bacterium]|nr:RluA family pseudouridine synthase [Candidatus Neomarinimicrobiota bacterium]